MHTSETRFYFNKGNSLTSTSWVIRLFIIKTTECKLRTSIKHPQNMFIGRTKTRKTWTNCWPQWCQDKVLSNDPSARQTNVNKWLETMVRNYGLVILVFLHFNNLVFWHFSILTYWYFNILTFRHFRHLWSGHDFRAVQVHGDDGPHILT